MVVGLAVLSAQQPVPKLPTPTFTPIPSTANEPRLNLTQQQWQRLFELYDQRKYDSYLYSLGIITRSEFYTRTDDNFDAQVYEIIAPHTGTPEGVIAWINSEEDLRRAIDKLWYGRQTPGWPKAETMRQILGFVIIQPTGTRATGGPGDASGFEMNLMPLTDQIYNNIKQQFETGLGVTMTYDAEFNRHTYVLRSNRSANGRPYYIEVQKLNGNRVQIEVIRLRSDP